MWKAMEGAWAGWKNYTEGGKLVALAIAAIVYLLLTARPKGPQGRLLAYAGIMMLACICPLTAVVLMKYQTAFYDYQWIWSMVPVTAVIAMGGTMFWTGQWKPVKGWKSMAYNIVMTFVSISILLLCGGLGAGSVDADSAASDRMHAEETLAQVRQHCDEAVCLWAPARILEYARLDGTGKLLYGRNMWDAALNAYSYDTYSAEEIELYRWMEHLDDWAIEISVDEVDEYVQRGFEAGADCILLPTEMSDWLIEPESEQVLLERLGTHEERELTVLEGYYLLERK